MRAQDDGPPTSVSGRYDVSRATSGGIVLVLGGTAEANALVSRLEGEPPAGRTILSLAGRTVSPRLPERVEVRIGGFGGVEGLCAYLVAEGVTHLVDATHPFAERISHNAFVAAETMSVPRSVFLRPAWERRSDDDWRNVKSVEEAAQILPAKARPFLALGRQHLAAFADRGDLAPVVRMIDPPTAPLGFDADLVLARPSRDSAEEAALLKARRVSHLVCRNAGGAASYAKIEAARQLRLPVIMIDRPSPPSPPICESVEAVTAWLTIAG